MARQQVRPFVPYGAVHLRGLHYRPVAAGDVVKPYGVLYINRDADWTWLQIQPAKAGRWLYVQFDRIIDERNAEPELVVSEPGAHPDRRPIRFISAGCSIEVPSAPTVLPYVYCDQLAQKQPYRIILIGEKTSLGPVLRASDHWDELLLPTGEASDTMIAEMPGRAADDGRLAVVPRCG